MSLRLRIRSGLFWIAWSAGMRFCMQFGLSVVLARLLSPADFGRTGMVGAVLALLAPLAGAGLQDAVIAAPDESKERLSSLFWLAIMLGFGTTALCVLGAPLLALYYDDPSVEPLARVMALTFMFTGLAVVPESLMRRRMAFSVVSRVEVTLSAIAAGAAIVCAVNGYGVWSLVVQSLLFAALACVSWWLASGFRPSASAQRRLMFDGLHFGAAVSATDICSMIANSAHTFVLGRLMGAAPLGIYARALNIPLLLQQQIGGLAQSVTMPVFASIEENARVRSAVLQTIAAIALVTAPIAGALVTCGDLVVAVLYGEKWLAAVTPMCVLAVATFLQITLLPISTLYRARRRPGLALAVAIIAVVLSIAAMTTGALLGGLTLVAVLHLARILIVAVPHVALGGGLVGIGMRDTLRALQSPVGCAAAMSVLVLAVRHFLELPPVAELAIAVPLGAVAYGGLAFGLRIEPLLNVMSFLRHRSQTPPGSTDAPR